MESIKRLFENDIFARHAGIELLDVAPGRSKAMMKIQPFHLNGVNLVQGGAIFTLADFAFAAAVNARGKIAVAVTTTISFTKPVSQGTVYAVAEEISLSNRLGTYRVTVTDDQGDPVAAFQGTAYRKS